MTKWRLSSIILLNGHESLSNFRRQLVWREQETAFNSLFHNEYLFLLVRRFNYTFTPSIWFVYDRWFMLNVCCWRFLMPKKKSNHCSPLAFGEIFMSSSRLLTLLSINEKQLQTLNRMTGSLVNHRCDDGCAPSGNFTINQQRKLLSKLLTHLFPISNA